MSIIDELIAKHCPDGVGFKKLGDLILALRTGLDPCANFVLNPPNATGYYVTIKELTGKEVLFSEKTDRLDDKAIELINNRSKLQVGDILFSGVGTIGKTALVEAAPKNWNINEGIYALTPNQKMISSKFLLYILSSSHVVRQLNAKSRGSTLLGISMAELRSVSISVPPLPVQQEIVSILDKFDAMANDAKQGLQAELKARRKQYEYYRDKLLTFY